MKNFVNKALAFMVVLMTIITATIPANVVWAADTDAASNPEVKYATVHDPSIVIGYADAADRTTAGKLTKGSVVYHEQNDENTRLKVYFVFGSHRQWAYSFDLMKWYSFTNNLSSETSYNAIFADEFAWAAMGDSVYANKDNMWAPDVIWNPELGKWCMYMSINGCSWNSSICMLIADSLYGDWEYVGPVVYSGFTDADNNHDFSKTDYTKVTGDTTLDSRYTMDAYTCKDGTTRTLTTTWNRLYGAHAIDPCVFYDDDNNLWMTYGSWSGGIYMLRLDSTTGLRDYNTTYEYKEGETDPYMGYHLAGGNQVSGEASYIQKIGDYYYMFVTLGGLAANGGYNMRVFRSENVTGPYVDESGDLATKQRISYNSSVGNRLMTYYKWSYMKNGYLAQGHNSAFVDTDGKAYVVYHTRNSGANPDVHHLAVHQLFTTEDGWLVAAPFEYTGESLDNSLEAESVEGAYEVIFHEGTDYTKLECVEGVKLYFKADGTVAGAASGTWSWSEAKGAPYADVVLDGQNYQGVFVEQYKDPVESAGASVIKTYTSGDKTMAFTILGAESEIAVWGYQLEQTDVGSVDGIKASSAANGVSISWNKNANAEGYYIYRKTAGGEWTKYADVAGADTLTYVDTAVTDKATYSYSVCPYNPLQTGTYDTTGITIQYVKPVVQPPVQQTTDNTVKVAATSSVSVQNAAKGVKVTWKKVANAKGYTVWRKTGSGKYSKIKTISSASTVTYTDTGAKNGSTYTYQVVAYNGSVTSAAKTSKSIVRLTAPKLSSAKNVSGKKIKVKYGKNAKANGYQIQYSTKKTFASAKITKVASAKKVSATIKKLTKKKTYYVRVRAYKKSGGKTYYSSWSNSKKVKITK